MKNPTYEQAVMHVVLHDNPHELDIDQIEESLAVALIADLWNRPIRDVAQDVAAVRIRMEATVRALNPFLV